MKRPLIILTGPTAVGKTELSIELAKAINGEIISADSMQVYKKMDIGTAKIKKEEMQGVPHYLIDILDPREDFNVVLFQTLAKQAMEKIYASGKIPIIVGGTGFYIQSILYDIDFTEEETDQEYRKQLEDYVIEHGAEALHAKLQEIDPQSATDIHFNNIKRVIRALEYYKTTGKQISLHNREQREKQSPYQFVYFVLNMTREILYERINKRIDLMLEEGLLHEVTALKEAGYQKGLVSMQGLGYKEILDYLNGEMTLEEAITLLKRDTRHFAKRQLTWFHREKEVTWVDKTLDTTTVQLLDTLLTILKEKQII